MINKIDVFYNEKLVGSLFEKDKKYGFKYDSNWLINGFSISPFSLPLEDKIFIPKNLNFNGLFGVFSDSLPDSFGRLLLEKFLIQHKKGDITEFDRLKYIDKNGMGALEYVPYYDINFECDMPDLDLYQKQANLLLDNELDDVDNLFNYGGSSGGARPKALIKISNQFWIVKFQSRFDIKNCGKIEYEYSLACKKCKIDMPETKLIQDQYFAVKRFDRLGNKKIHMISAAALLEADFKSPCADYLDLFKLTKIITRDNAYDIEQLYRRMCFNVLAHNLDDHLKNFSFIYNEDEKKYRLSPAYDMTYSSTYFKEHTTSVNKKGKDITDDDIVYVAVKSGLSKNKAVQILNEIKTIVNNNLSKFLNIKLYN